MDTQIYQMNIYIIAKIKNYLLNKIVTHYDIGRVNSECGQRYFPFEILVSNNLEVLQCNIVA